MAVDVKILRLDRDVIIRVGFCIAGNFMGNFFIRKYKAFKARGFQGEILITPSDQ